MRRNNKINRDGSVTRFHGIDDSPEGLQKQHNEFSYPSNNYSRYHDSQYPEEDTYQRHDNWNKKNKGKPLNPKGNYKNKFPQYEYTKKDRNTTYDHHDFTKDINEEFRNIIDFSNEQPENENEDYGHQFPPSRDPSELGNHIQADGSQDLIYNVLTEQKFPEDKVLLSTLGYWAKRSNQLTREVNIRLMFNRTEAEQPFELNPPTDIVPLSDQAHDDPEWADYDDDNIPPLDVDELNSITLLMQVKDMLGKIKIYKRRHFISIQPDPNAPPPQRNNQKHNNKKRGGGGRKHRW